MNGALRDLESKAWRVCDDLSIAATRHDLAIELYEAQQRAAATPAAPTLFCFADALLHRSVSALLRTLDRNRTYASIPGLLSKLDEPAVRSVIVGRLWQRLRHHGTSVERAMFLDPAITDITTLHAREYLERATADLRDKVSRINGNSGFKRFRNREMAHAAVEMRGDDATFAELEAAIDLGWNMRRTLWFLLIASPLPDHERRRTLQRHREIIQTFTASFETS